MMNIKRLYVVEDNFTHIRAAERVLKDAKPLMLQDFYFFQQNFAKILKSVEEGVLISSEVGFLTDLYFPVEFDRGPYGDLAPLGLLVMAECRRHNVPCVIVTAGHHHGSKYNQICLAGRKMDWPDMVDSGKGEEEAQEKNWEEGLRRLEEIAGEYGAG